MPSATIYISSTTTQDSIRNAHHKEVFKKAGIDLSMTCRLPPNSCIILEFLEKSTLQYQNKKRVFDYENILVDVDNMWEERNLVELAFALTKRFPKKNVILVTNSEHSFDGVTRVNDLASAASIINHQEAI